MFKLQPVGFLDGNQTDSCLKLSSLQRMELLTPPIEVADIRSMLEAGQDDTFSDAAFNQYLQGCLDLPVVEASLTNSEISLLNTIRLYLNPAPSLSCCSGSSFPLAADVDLIANARAGTGVGGTETYEYEFRVVFNGLFRCDIAQLAAMMTFDSATIDQEDRTFLSLGCVNGSQTFSWAWSSFDDDPIGGELTAEFTFQDVNGNDLSITTIEKVITL